MPTRFVGSAPRRLTRWKGVSVWHTYRDDDMTQISAYYFTVDENQTDCKGMYDEGVLFNVMQLPTWNDDLEARVRRAAQNDFSAQREVIRAAIDAGYVTQQGLRPAPTSAERLAQEHGFSGIQPSPPRGGAC
jgi:hypothetical protein